MGLCFWEDNAVLSPIGRQKDGFVKGWFWRMYPRSRCRSGGTCERTLVPVFVPGEHPFFCTLVPVVRQKYKPPFWKTTLRLLATPDSPIQALLGFL